MRVVEIILKPKTLEKNNNCSIEMFVYQAANNNKSDISIDI